MSKHVLAIAAAAGILLAGVGLLAQSFDAPVFGTASQTTGPAECFPEGSEARLSATDAAETPAPSVGAVYYLGPPASLDDARARTAQLVADATAAGAVPTERAAALHAEIARLAPKVGPDAVMAAQRELSEAMRRLATKLEVAATERGPSASSR